MKLTAKYIATITAPGRYYDDTGLGLFLDVRVSARAESGIRSQFVQRITIAGKRRDIGIGSSRWLTLTEARATAHRNMKTARMGGDPRKVREAIPTFADALDKVLDIQRDAWKDGGKSERQWRASLRDNAGALMPMTVDSVGPGDVLAVLTPIWNAKRETARRVRQRVSKVLDWAVAEGHRSDNPVAAIGAALPKNGQAKAHHKALPYADVKGALAAVQASGAYPTTKLAFELLVFTATRSGEVRGMKWSEVDGRTWSVPGERMKAGREHRVPLSDAALEVLDQARPYRDKSGLVFPSARGRVMSDMTLSKLLKDRGVAAVPHGFRSSFRDWAAERTSTPHAVMEMALAHTIKDKAEAAYARSDLLDKRAVLMTAWARYLTESGKVVRLATA